MMRRRMVGAGKDTGLERRRTMTKPRIISVTAMLKMMVLNLERSLMKGTKVEAV